MYDPFRRFDKYGKAGLKPQPWYEYVRLALFTMLLFPIKALGLAISVISCWLVCQLAFLIPNQHRMAVVRKLGKWHCRVCLFFLGFVRITWVKDFESGESDAAAGKDPIFAAVIANHVSPVDILLLMSRYFPSFVSKQSVRTAPFIGAVSQYMECVFVDIKAKASGGSLGTSSAVKERMQAIAAGADMQPMCIFPEGTTTNGTHLIPFKTGAFLAGEPVKPHILTYSAYHVSPAWESIDMFRLLFLILANPVHTVTIKELPVYVPSAAEAADPKLYAENVRQYMLKHSALKPSPATYKDELDYIKIITAAINKSKKSKNAAVAKQE